MAGFLFRVDRIGISYYSCYIGQQHQLIETPLFGDRIQSPLDIVKREVYDECHTGRWLLDTSFFSEQKTKVN